MHTGAIDYCKQCDTCQHTIFLTQAPYRLAKPLPIPTRPFTHLSMDSLELLTKIIEEGQIFNAVWTIVDRFSGYVRIIPINKSYGAPEIIEIFTSTIYPEWGLPDDIVSDMDTRFTSKPFKAWCEYHNINQSMSTAYHPRTDGQSEVANKSIVQKIKHEMFDGHSNWLAKLPFTQTKINRTYNSSRRASPDEIIHGVNP